MLFDPLYFPMDELETSRLVIRRLTARDAPDLFAYCKDPEVARHVLWEAQSSVSESRAYIRAMTRRYRAGEPASWGIELRENGRVIGTIGYMWHQGEHNAAEIGYSLARDRWNRGYMTEALRAVAAYSFDELHINRLEAQHETSNPASGAVMRKAGFKHEGTLRQRLFNKGRFVDVELYALLRSEYVALR